MKTPSGGWPKDRATSYALSVHRGEEVAGPHVRAACRRHLRDLVDGPKRGLTWDLDAVDYAIGFFETVLRLNGGQFEGEPFVLHPSQAFIVGSLFGWKRASTGHRRFRRAIIEIGKGKGKSPSAAGIGILGLIADGEPRAEIYSGAARKEQAEVLFRDAIAMIRQSPPLKKRLEPGISGGEGKEFNVRDGKTNSFFRPISRDVGKTGSGPRPHFALCDEVHEHPDGKMIEILERGFKFRRQPLLLMITNSGSDRKSVCYAEHEHAIAVAHGHSKDGTPYEDDTTFSYVCSLDEGEDPLEDSSCWKKANPLLGTILTEEYLAGVVKQAKQIAGKRNNILRLHFCVWTDADTAWLERATWEALEDPTLDIADFAGAKAWAGLDLSAMRDLTARAVLVEDGETEDGKPKFALFAKGYMAEEGLHQRAEIDRAPYDLWVEEGWITATPGKMIGLEWVARDCIEDAETFDLQALAYDNWLYTRFAEALDEMGVELPVVEHPQGWNRRRDSNLSMPTSIDAFETMILEGRLRAQPNPALRSAIMSAQFETSPAGLRRFTKQKATSRIDLAVSAAMAAGAAEGAEVEGASTYEGEFYV